MYERAHKLDPHRHDGMDLYASALWHLNRETSLSCLADDLQKSDKLKPQVTSSGCVHNYICIIAGAMCIILTHEPVQGSRFGDSLLGEGGPGGPPHALPTDLAGTGAHTHQELR